MKTIIFILLFSAAGEPDTLKPPIISYHDTLADCQQVWRMMERELKETKLPVKIHHAGCYKTRRGGG